MVSLPQRRFLLPECKAAMLPISGHINWSSLIGLSGLPLIVDWFHCNSFMPQVPFLSNECNAAMLPMSSSIMMYDYDDDDV